MSKECFLKTMSCQNTQEELSSETKVLALCFALPCNFLPYSSSLLKISIIYNLSF